MPLPMVHLLVGKSMIDIEFGVNDLGQFYLGLIAPDAIHMRAGVGRAEKNGTHLLPNVDAQITHIGEAEQSRTVLDFVHEHLDKFDADFLWGYGVHLLTDLLWTHRIYMAFTKKYEEDPAPVQERQQAYYNDADLADIALYRESPWRAAIWTILQQTKAADFSPLLSAQEIDAWNHRTLNWYDEKEPAMYHPIKYLTKATVEAFIPQCAKAIHDVIGCGVRV